MAQRKTVKEYAHEALDCFDRMAMPEIKNRVMSSIWGFLRKYIKKTIDKKPDAELHEKLFEIYKTLNPLFESLQTSAEIQKAEALGSPKVPRVGDLARDADLIKMDKKKAAELLEEFLRQ
jgi:hypothetical protein